MMAFAAHFRLLLAGVITCGRYVVGATLDDSLPNMVTASFIPLSFTPLTFTATGNSSNITGRTTATCNSAVPAFSAADILEDLAIALTNIGSGCFASEAYSHANYLVEQGTVTGGGANFDAYRVFPRAQSASKWAASGQNVHLRLTANADYKVYLLDSSGILSEVDTFKGGNATRSFFVDTGVKVFELSAPTVIVPLLASQAVPELAKKTFVGTEATACMARIPPTAVIGDVAVVTLKSDSGTCWTDNRYTNRDFQVEKGSLTTSDGGNFVAYRFSPPATLATQFVASGAGLYVRAAQTSSIVVTSFDGATFRRLATVNLTAGSFTSVGVAVHSLTAPIILLFYPDSTRLSEWPLVSQTVEGARVAGGTDFGVAVRRFATPGKPFQPEVDWVYGPGQHNGNYGIPKKFFAVSRTDGREGVVWQDEATRSVHMTWFAQNLQSATTTQLVSGQDFLLAASSDRSSQIVLVLIGSSTNSDKTRPTTAQAIKLDSTSGAELARASLPTAKTGGFDLYQFSESGGSIAWDTSVGTIGLMFARTMTQSADGLNHQGGIAIVLNASTLALIKNHGQTSGHSFANSIGLGEGNTYLGMDLGDNYPRGINVWRYDALGVGRLRSRLVYTFKTSHGTSPTSPAGASYPQYTEISTPAKTYYKWSNDNYIYTELGHPGIFEVNDGILVFFSGERPPLDNSQVGAVLNVARNLGFLKIPKDLTSTEVLSPGGNETGGFYTFGGTWSAQRNQGVNFLTSLSDRQTSVSRLKTVRLAVGKNLLWWEVWAPDSYAGRTQFMVVDDNGQVTKTTTDVGYPVRLPIADDLRVVNGRVVAYAGSASGQVVRYEICVLDSCPAPPPPPPTTYAPSGAQIAATTTTMSGGGGGGGGGGNGGGAPGGTSTTMGARISQSVPQSSAASTLVALLSVFSAMIGLVPTRR